MKTAKTQIILISKVSDTQGCRSVGTPLATSHLEGKMCIQFLGKLLLAVEISCKKGCYIKNLVTCDFFGC